MAGSREKDNWSKKGKMLYFVTYLYEYMKNAYLPCFNVTNIRFDFDNFYYEYKHHHGVNYSSLHKYFVFQEENSYS